MNRKEPLFNFARRGYHHGRLKDALIEAARCLVAERGPAGFTLAEAAKLVGVTAAAPYRHFADRNELMGELARRGFALFGERLANAWDEGRPDPLQAFRRMGAAYLAFARAEPGLYAAMFGQLKCGPLAEAIGDKALETLEWAARAILAQSGAETSRIHAAAHELAYEIWSLSHGVAMLSLAGHFGAAGGPDPATIMEKGAAALTETAIRRLRGS
jgi:AcrR family transcriptional regulator